MPPTQALLPWLPGAATASEAMRLFERGYRLQKFFPAVPAGGVPLSARLGLARCRGISFCPTGGISAGKRSGFSRICRM